MSSPIGVRLWRFKKRNIFYFVFWIRSNKQFFRISIWILYKKIEKIKTFTPSAHRNRSSMCWLLIMLINQYLYTFNCIYCSFLKFFLKQKNEFGLKVYAPGLRLGRNVIWWRLSQYDYWLRISRKTTRGSLRHLIIWYKLYFISG